MWLQPAKSIGQLECMNGRIAAHKIYRSAENIFVELHQFRYLQVQARRTHARATDRNEVGDFIGLKTVVKTVADGIHGQEWRLPVIHGHALLQRREGIQVFCLRVKPPFGQGPGIIGNDRIPLAYPALLVEETHFSFVHLIGRINGLHKWKYLHLRMTVGWNGCAYGKDLAQ